MSDTDTTDPTIDDAPTSDTEPVTDPVAEAKAEVEKWKAHAREQEKRAKANVAAVTELEKLRKSQMSEVEKAVAEAEARGRTAALAEVGTKVAHAQIVAALTGVVPDPASIIEDLNLSRYVTDTGDVDAKAIAALRDKYAQITAKAAKDSANPTVPTGPRGGANQLTRDSLKNMTPDEIVTARREGRLDSILRG